MAPYHHLLVHFPIALWTVAAMIIILRAFSDGTLARNAAAVLAPLLALGVLSGIVAYAIGLSVFPYEAISSSPLGRNKLTAATLALWAQVLHAVPQARLLLKSKQLADAGNRQEGGINGIAGGEGNGRNIPGRGSVVVPSEGGIQAPELHAGGRSRRNSAGNDIGNTDGDNADTIIVR